MEPSFSACAASFVGSDFWIHASFEASVLDGT